MERGLSEVVGEPCASGRIQIFSRPQVKFISCCAESEEQQLKIRMSIEAIQQLGPSVMESSPLKHNSEKKHKSKEGKKRKRDHEDGEDSRRQKTKKHRKHESKEERIKNSMVGDFENARRSPFHIQTSSIYLPLAPISQRQPLEGMCAEHLSPLILTYYPPLGGVILSYSNVRISEQPFDDDGDHILLQCIDEYAAFFYSNPKEEAG